MYDKFVNGLCPSVQSTSSEYYELNTFYESYFYTTLGIMSLAIINHTTRKLFNFFNFKNKISNKIVSETNTLKPLVDYSSSDDSDSDDEN